MYLKLLRILVTGVFAVCLLLTRDLNNLSQLRTRANRAYINHITASDNHHRYVRPLRYSEVSNAAMSDVILTSFFVSKKDPQRGKYMEASIKYMQSFYESVTKLKLHVVIFHDVLADNFTMKYSTDNVEFVRVELADDMSMNDFRFIAYKDWLLHHQYRYVLNADISDVVFGRNPFDYMVEHGEYSIFLSPDDGTFATNKWMVSQIRHCYHEYVTSYDHPLRSQEVYNAGVWGGKYELIKCLIDCINKQLLNETKGRFNCDMPVYNWCIYYSACYYAEEYGGERSGFTNPFGKECDETKHSIIHDKCKHRPQGVYSGNNMMKFASSKYGSRSRYGSQPWFVPKHIRDKYHIHLRKNGFGHSDLEVKKRREWS